MGSAFPNSTFYEDGCRVDCYMETNEVRNSVRKPTYSNTLKRAESRVWRGGGTEARHVFLEVHTF